MYGGGDELLAGAFDEDAQEDEIHAKKGGKQNKKSKKQQEREQK